MNSHSEGHFSMKLRFHTLYEEALKAETSTSLPTKMNGQICSWLADQVKKFGKIMEYHKN